MRCHTSDPVARGILAARLRRQKSIAVTRGNETERRVAEDAAKRLADKALAFLLRDVLPDDELAIALAEYLEAKADGFDGWHL